MGPRTKGKQEPRREVDEGRPTVADLQGESPFAQLAKENWLKPSKKGAKVKVKADILKTEIWDVLQQENFAFKSLLVLENLQILERLVYWLSILLIHALLTASIDTCGQDIPRTRPISMSFLLF
jgi:intron-binding protein aquarius